MDPKLEAEAKAANFTPRMAMYKWATTKEEERVLLHPYVHAVIRELYANANLLRGGFPSRPPESPRELLSWSGDGIKIWGAPPIERNKIWKTYQEWLKRGSLEPSRPPAGPPE